MQLFAAKQKFFLINEIFFQKIFLHNESEDTRWNI